MCPANDSFYRRLPESRHRTGAGGAVVRLSEQGLLLALVKEAEIGDDHYVLPKGGVEAGEGIEQAARREIAEETGVTDLRYLGPLGTLSRMNFKQTYWQTTHYGLYVTQQEYGIAMDPDNYGLAWFSLDCLPSMFWRDETQMLASRAQWIAERVAQPD